MLRRVKALMVMGVCAVSTSAAAQDPVDTPASEPAPAESERPATEESAAEKPADESAPDPTPEPAPAPAPDTNPEPVAPPSSSEKPSERSKGFETFVSGYFRAPVSMGLSPRTDPGDPNGEEHLQISYGPTRTLDSNYYSFAYTRLQEQDWAEVFFHAKKKHVEAVVGWMGYWFQSAGFRNSDAAWVPGMAYLVLDTDFSVGRIKPNVALTAGAWWPKFGYIEKYDTYTLGQFRQIGEQLKLTIPFSSDLALTLYQGFGTGRDGSFNINAPAPYQATVGLDLIHYEHIQVTYGKYLDLGVHFNHQWTRDPNLFQAGGAGTSYSDARAAKFTTVGGEVAVSAPRAGRLWVSPSYTRLRNGWALANAGTEIMHSLGGVGFAANYLAWDESVRNSSGTGASLNLGFVYENKLSTILDKPEETLPEVTLNVFGLFIDSKLDLPTGSIIPQDRIAQMKYGADLSVQPLSWLGVMLRWDEVNYDLDHPGYVFSAITPRVTFSSHFLSGESIYLQYSRYRYGDRMVLAGRWPWGAILVPGANFTQTSYPGEKPDMDVIKIQASVSF
jgi:hypothetical protein